jgi:hypothetical protein
MFNKKNSERIYYIIRYLGPLFYLFYFNEITHLVNVFYQKINATLAEKFHQIGLILFELELILFMIQVIAFYSFISFLFLRIKVFIRPVTDKFKLFLLSKLKDSMDTLSEKNRNRLYFSYYSITLTSPIYIFCYFFQNEISNELYRLLIEIILIIIYFDPSLISYILVLYAYFFT